MMETNDISSDDKAVVKVDKNNIPDEIPILPLDEQMAFPTLNMSLGVSLRATPLVESAMKDTRLIGVVGTKVKTDNDPLPGQVYKIGTVVQILSVTRAPDNSILLIVQG
ncbi:MAG: LON peptidase substrate-binding domain-containing protein, partial [Desulfobacterales bacterium]